MHNVLLLFQCKVPIYLCVYYRDWVACYLSLFVKIFFILVLVRMDEERLFRYLQYKVVLCRKIRREHEHFGG